MRLPWCGAPEDAAHAGMRKVQPPPRQQAHARQVRNLQGELNHATELLLPTIIFWETALLVRKRGLELPVSPSTWLRGLRSTARAQVVPLTAEIALRADRLRMHDDPADRFIVATALAKAAPLITKDKALHAAKLVATIW